MSKEEVENPQAFARPYGEYKEVGAGKYNNPQTGMTLRDYFAAKAMQAIITTGLMSSEFEIGETGKSNEQVTRVSYGIADAMLKQRQNQEQ